jgi:hypothetical protein
VGVIVERVTTLIVPHLTVKHAENGVDVVPVNFIRERLTLTKPLNVAVSKITDNMAVNAVPVLVVGIEHRVPDDVFGKAVGLNLTEGNEGEDVFIHNERYLGLHTTICEYRAKLAAE